MCTIHGSPYWTPTTFGAKQFKKTSATFGSIQGWKITEPSILNQKVRIYCNLFDELGETVKKILNFSNIAPPFKQMNQRCEVNPSNALEISIDKLKQTAICEGLKNEYLDEMIEIAKRFILVPHRDDTKQAIPTEKQVSRFSFSKQITDSEFNQWLKEIYTDAMAFLYQSLNVQSLGVCTFNAEEMALIGVDKAHPIDPKRMSCADYIFIKKRDILAIEFFKQGKKADLNTLKDWGYVIVLHPDENDLVLYVGDDHLTIQHYGLYTHNGLVESKWGNANSAAFKHRVFDVPVTYGMNVIFMRKSSFLKNNSPSKGS
jgi:hypothetical protein